MTRVFHSSDLAQRDGKNGSPILIAFEGKVYDVSSSYHWRGGKHQALHLAGRDLTLFMKAAPHGEDLLQRFPVLGLFQP